MEDLNSQTVSSRVQALIQGKSGEIQLMLKTLNVDQVSKDKAFQTMTTVSFAQLISAPSLQAKLGPAGPQVAWAGIVGFRAGGMGLQLQQEID